VKMLVENNSNVNFIHARSKMTAMHWAAFHDDQKVITYLLNKGAKLVYSFEDKSPLDLVCRHGNDFLANEVIKQYWK